ncbi:MAG: response regulator [Terrimicrobiaceae bacterium]
MKTQNDILLVEDNPYDAELTILALKRRNLANSLTHVTDGQAAVDFLFATGLYANRCGQPLPKVVMLDLKLPKMDGIEVLRAIRSDERTKFLPVVILTSSREVQDLISSYKLGANSYIVKPVDFDKFSEAVANLGLYWLLINEPPPASIQDNSP